MRCALLQVSALQDGASETEQALAAVQERVSGLEAERADIQAVLKDITNEVCAAAMRTEPLHRKLL